MSASLFAWVATLPPFEGKNKQPTSDNFKDGVIISKILKEVIDPEFFGGLKSSPNESTPLVQVIKRMRQYFAEQVRITLSFLPLI